MQEAASNPNASRYGGCMAWQAVVRELWAKYGKQAAVWVLKQIGAEKVRDLVEAQLDGLVARRRAIHKARQTRDGRWGPILVEGRGRFVVYSGETPSRSSLQSPVTSPRPPRPITANSFDHRKTFAASSSAAG